MGDVVKFESKSIKDDAFSEFDKMINTELINTFIKEMNREEVEALAMIATLLVSAPKEMKKAFIELMGIGITKERAEELAVKVFADS